MIYKKEKHSWKNEFEVKKQYYLQTESTSETNTFWKIICVLICLVIFSDYYK